MRYATKINFANLKVVMGSLIYKAGDIYYSTPILADNSASVEDDDWWQIEFNLIDEDLAQAIRNAF